MPIRRSLRLYLEVLYPTKNEASRRVPLRSTHHASGGPATRSEEEGECEDTSRSSSGIVGPRRALLVNMMQGANKPGGLFAPFFVALPSHNSELCGRACHDQRCNEYPVDERACVNSPGFTEEIGRDRGDDDVDRHELVRHNCQQGLVGCAECATG